MNRHSSVTVITAASRLGCLLYCFLSPPPSLLRLTRRPLSVVLPAAKTLALKHSPFISSMDDPFPPDPAATTSEDYVHIEDPSPNVESLGVSFVGVEDSAGEMRMGPLPLQQLTQVTAAKETVRCWIGAELRCLRNYPGVMVLTCESSAPDGICEVHLVGTAHIPREVEAVISCLKPEVPAMGEMVDMWKKKHYAFGIIYGSEFRVAFEEAMKYGGKVILGDRPVQAGILKKDQIKIHGF